MKNIQLYTLLFTVRRHLTKVNFHVFSRLSGDLCSQETRLWATGQYRGERPVSGLQLPAEISLGRPGMACSKSHLFGKNRAMSCMIVTWSVQSNAAAYHFHVISGRECDYYIVLTACGGSAVGSPRNTDTLTLTREPCSLSRLCVVQTVFFWKVWVSKESCENVLAWHPFYLEIKWIH